MHVLIVSAGVFALTLAAGALGLIIHSRLPPDHKSDNTRSVVGQIAGLVSLLLALVLGTLVGTSFSYFGTQKSNIEALSTQILLLDDALARVGPETKPVRNKLKQAVVEAYNTFWGDGDANPKLLSVSAPLATAKALRAFLASLKPETDVQKQAIESADALVVQSAQTRILMNLQIASHPVTSAIMIAIVIWATILFFGIGLFAQTNPLVISAMTFGALCVAFAMFLILELGLPYTGMFRVSGAALQAAIENIDR